MRKYLDIQPALPSFLSEERDLAVQQWIPAGQDTGVDRGVPDMVGMARWNMRYLLNNPQPERGYECRFSISPLDCPPAPRNHEHDPVAVGDTESRMELEFVYMREMTGDAAGAEVEEGIRSRLLSYLRDDGLCWCSPRCLGKVGDGIAPAAMSWTTGYLLLSSTERYARTGDERFRQLGRRLVEGLRRLASRRGDRMWYEGGLAAWQEGAWLTGCQDHYPAVVQPLVRYWEVTGEEDVLAFAEAMAEGIVSNEQRKLRRQRVAPDGSHGSSNTHLTMRALLGVAQVGVITGNARFLEFARRAYEFTRSYSTDWGWYPENLAQPEYRYWSETCVTGDMVECALAFARAGYMEYWDHVERAARNYLPEAQFFLTPEFIALYHKQNAERSADEIAAGLRLLRHFEGGFLARQRPNDWVYRRGGKWQMNMMGCCPPEGMRALYHAWRNAVVSRDGVVFVSLALDCAAPEARVTACAPRRGSLKVEARRAADYHLRPPSWAPQAQARVSVNGQEASVEWSRGYVVVRRAQPGDLIEMETPLPRFTQSFPIGCEGSEEFYKAQWVGNDVIEVTPRGAFLPIFTGSRRPLPPLPSIAFARTEDSAELKETQA